jgi:hypothetical protein
MNDVSLSVATNEDALMFNEDTEEDILCPVCDAPEYWECGHLVADIDRTFAECKGGVLFNQMGMFSNVIKEAFLRLLKADDEPVFKSVNLEELWHSTQQNFEPKDDDVILDTDIFLRFLIEILEEAGANDLAGSIIESGGPGMTSAVSLLFDDEPKVVVRNAHKALVAVVA